MKSLQNHALGFILAASVSALPQAASAATYQFSQSGYADGATVSGSFTGTDLDHDGQINSFFGEVSAFMMTFSGNGTIPGFSHGLAELSGLVYTVGNSTLGADLSGGTEGMASNWGGTSGYDFASGHGPTANDGGRIIDTATGATTSTRELIQISAVPEPSSALLLLAGLGLVGAALRRRPTR
jgi:hypothetical protein